MPRQKMANPAVTHKAKEEDILECFLYPKFCYASDPDAVTEAKLSEEIAKYNEEIAPFITDYIWHGDSLNFRPRTKQAMLLNRILEGSAVEEGIYFISKCVIFFTFFLFSVEESLINYNNQSFVIRLPYLASYLCESAFRRGHRRRMADSIPNI